MTNFEERTIGELVVRIDRLLCVGFEDCVTCAPEVFRMDDEGIATFTEEPGAVGAERLVDACRACPVDAITILGSAGQQIAP